MHKDLVFRYIEFQALLLTPIAPHWADFVWQEVLHKVKFNSINISCSFHAYTNHPTQPDTVQNALWPPVPASNPSLTASRDYVRATSSAITSAEAAQLKKKDKGKTIAFDPKLPKRLTIFAATKYPAWQDKYIDLVRTEFEKGTLNANDKALVAMVGKMGEGKKAMPFVQGLKKQLTAAGGAEKPETVLERQLPFDEVATLKEMAAGLRRTTGCRVVDVVVVEEGGKAGTVVLGEGEGEGKGKGERREGLPLTAEAAVPGTPSFYFENVG